MFASARQICTARHNRARVSLEGVDAPVEVVGLTLAEAQALQEISRRHGADVSHAYAWLVRRCCPAFRWWTVRRIRRRLPASTMTRLAREIMAVSGLGDGAVEDAAKNSASVPGTDSSSN